jgi:hypothetical protein
MNRRNIFTLSAITALGLVSGSAVAQQGTLKQQLVGSWTLVSDETTVPNGRKQLPWGANPKGILIFDAGGRFANVFGKPDRPKLKSGPRAADDAPRGLTFEKSIKTERLPGGCGPAGASAAAETG